MEDRDIDIESDEEDRPSPVMGGSTNKRAHHNALERKRRDHIKESFNGLRDSVPSLEGEKSSRAQILNKATDYIQMMKRKNISHQQDIDDLKRQNKLLEQQIKELEKTSRQFQQNGADDTSGLDSDESAPQQSS